MSTKNIECQLAQGQIGRYLNGERFSPTALKQLEAHVADCDECSELVSRRRKALMSMLGERNSNLAVVSPKTGSESRSPIPPDESLKAALQEAMAKTGEVSEKPGPANAAASETVDPISKVQMFGRAMNSKPLAWCAGLAVVLIVMSYFSRGAMKFFGPTAEQAEISEKVKPTQAPVNEHLGSTPPISKPSVTPVPAPVAVKTPKPISVAPSKPQGITSEAPEVESPQTHVSGHPHFHRIHRRSLANRRSMRRVSLRRRISLRASRNLLHRRHARIRVSKPHHVNSKSGVRLYDPQGRPIN